MSSLELSFSDLYSDVSRFVGTYGTSGPSGTDLTDAKNAVNAGYRRFLSAHRWSFLRKLDKIITVANTWEYLLPDDFGRLIGTIHYYKDSAYSNLLQMDYGEILEFRSASEYISFPIKFAIRRSEYAPEQGGGWIVGIYPTPDSAYTLLFFYTISPQKLANDSDMPICTIDTAEALRSCCLAEAEGFLDENTGRQEQTAMARLQEAINRDVEKRPNNLGYFGDGQKPILQEITRGQFRVNSVTWV